MTDIETLIHDLRQPGGDDRELSDRFAVALGWKTTGNDQCPSGMWRGPGEHEWHIGCPLFTRDLTAIVNTLRGVDRVYSISAFSGGEQRYDWTDDRIDRVALRPNRRAGADDRAAGDETGDGEMTREHDLKCLPDYFVALENGDKTFEVRRDDRGFQKGDLTPPPDPQPEESYQSRVKAWLVAAFGEAAATDPRYRTFRFLEEAIELAQATGCTADEARQLVAYVFSRPVGEPSQEVGGVMVSLSGLCSAFEINAVDAGETELARCWSAIEKIRAKQAAKEASGDNGPLPGYAALPEGAITVRLQWEGERLFAGDYYVGYVSTVGGQWRFQSTGGGFSGWRSTQAEARTALMATAKEALDRTAPPLIRPRPDPPELAHMDGQFILGYRQAQDDAEREIGRLRTGVRVNLLRLFPSLSHKAIDAILNGGTDDR
jgi:hypothetical protein